MLSVQVSEIEHFFYIKSLATHFTVDLDHQVRLADFQTICMTELPNTIDLLKNVFKRQLTVDSAT